MASRSGFVVLAAALVAAAFATASSSARTEFAAEPAAQGEKFVSQRYGFEISLVGFDWWDAIDAQHAWTGEFPFGSIGQTDLILVPGHKFNVGAKRVPAGTTLRKWEASRIANMQAVCEKARAFRATTIGGVAAREFSLVCPGFDVIAVVALHRGRGYLVNFLTDNGAPTAPARRIFEAIRRTFRFTSK